MIFFVKYNAFLERLARNMFVLGALFFYSGPTFAQQNLSDSKRAASVQAATELSTYEKQLDAALVSRDTKEITRLSRNLEKLLPPGIFIGGVERQSPAYQLMWSCETALSKMSLVALLAEGLVTRQPQATSNEFMKSVTDFSQYSGVCKSGLGVNTPLVLTLQHAGDFIKALK